MAKRGVTSWLKAVSKAWKTTSKNPERKDVEDEADKKRCDCWKKPLASSTPSSNDPNSITVSLSIKIEDDNAAEGVRDISPCSRILKEHYAAIVIQTTYRGYLARKALMALKSLVKLQAMVRGYIVRKQVEMTLQRMQSLMRIQERTLNRRIGMSKNSINQDKQWGKNGDEVASHRKMGRAMHSLSHRRLWSSNISCTHFTVDDGEEVRVRPVPELKQRPPLHMGRRKDARRRASFDLSKHGFTSDVERTRSHGVQRRLTELTQSSLSPCRFGSRMSQRDDMFPLSERVAPPSRAPRCRRSRSYRPHCCGSEDGVCWCRPMCGGFCGH